MVEDQHLELKRLVAAFENLNPFAEQYLTKLLFESYQAEIQRCEGQPLKRKSLGVILEKALFEAKRYVVQHEMEIHGVVAKPLIKK